MDGVSQRPSGGVTPNLTPEGNMVPLVVVMIALVALGVRPAPASQVSYFDVPHGAHPHDVAPAPDGTVWYTAQHQGAIGILDPKTGKVTQVSLGSGAAPHGVIVGPDRAAWKIGRASGRERG